jgi:hypothetical protein
MRLLKRLAVPMYAVPVLVLCAGCASISAFSANPRTVCAGDPVMVTWAAVGDVTIAAEPPVAEIGQKSSSGSQRFVVDRDTRFTLKARRLLSCESTEADVVPPDAAYIQPFETTGARVRALIASPFVEGGTCYHGHLDHTSLLQLFAEKFAGDRRAYSPRADVPSAPTPPRPVRHVLRPARPPLVNENQKAMLLAGQHLLTHDQVRALREFPELG